MKVLVVNAGSTSVKFKLYDMDDKSEIAQGNCQRVGLPDSEIKYIGKDGKKSLIIAELPDHASAFAKIMELLTTGDTKVVDSVSEIDAAGHRISMGGGGYVNTVFADDKVLQTAEELSSITPLHNPPQINGVRACRAVFGDIPMTVGFDTAYHQTMPETSYIYPIPYEYFEKYNVRRFGFHGLSYQFVAHRYAEITGNDYSNHKMVVCHLGGGASATAVNNGKSVDNSFGLGTGDGLLCGTRAGAFDHVAIGYIMKETGMNFDEIQSMLHKESGLLGISGISGDEREIEDAAAAGNRRAQLALDVMVHQIKKYIGAYAFEMGGLDTIVFTGGIGENSDAIRSMSCKGLEAFGIELDEELNVTCNRQEGMISSQSSKVEIWIIPTNEELVIAQDTVKLLEMHPERRKDN